MKTKISEHLATNLKILRKSHRLSQEAFAARIGTSNLVVSRWELRYNVPHLDTVDMIADVFGIDPGWFFRDNKNGEPAGIPSSLAKLLYAWVPRLAALWGGEAVKNPQMETIPKDLLVAVDRLAGCDNTKTYFNSENYTNSSSSPDLQCLSDEARMQLGLQGF